MEVFFSSNLSRRQTITISMFIFIVALNQQTQGLDTDLNIARFKSNGSCGYVLKPAILRQPSAVFNPEATGPLNLPGVVPRVIQLKVMLV